MSFPYFHLKWYTPYTTRFLFLQKWSSNLKFLASKLYLVADLFTNKCLRIVTLKLIVMWIFTAMAYYGLIFGELPGDTLTNNLLNSIMECSLMPFVIGFINHKYGLYCLSYVHISKIIFEILTFF